MAMQVARGDGIRAALADGRVPLGMQAFSGSAALVEIIGHAAFDFVMLDMEHTSLDFSQVESLVRAADGVALTTLVRVSDNHPTAIRKALEAGASGVIVPRVRTTSEVEQALEAAHFPPHGSRGSCVAVRGTGYSTEGWRRYMAWSNNEVSVIPILEHPDAIEHVEEICSLDGIGTVLFGPGDLGLTLGLGVEGMSHPQLRDTLDRVIEVAHRTDTLVMCVPFPDVSADACRDLVERGVDILLHSIDALLFSKLCHQIRAELATILRADPLTNRPSS
jgi:2-keto-3-deoxy-L-rhamnonate aldolase RhmA